MYSMTRLTDDLVSIVWYSLIMHSWWSLLRIAISRLTLLRFWGSISLCLSYILIATFLSVYMSLASLTIAYEPFPITHFISYRSINFIVDESISLDAAIPSSSLLPGLRPPPAAVAVEGRNVLLKFPPDVKGLFVSPKCFSWPLLLVISWWLAFSLSFISASLSFVVLLLLLDCFRVSWEIVERRIDSGRARRRS